jgi:carboxyl-terminal processing protease
MSRWRTVVVAAAYGAALGAGAWFVRHARAEGRGPTSGARLFETVRRQIADRYVEPLADSVLYRKAVDGLLDELGDPNTAYLPPARFRQLAERAAGSYAGIGARVDARDGWPTVIAPIPGSPADSAGIATADRIVEIEGRSTRGWSTEETVRAIRGDAGSIVRFLVERPGVPGRQAYALARREIHVRAVGRAATIAPGVGYLDLNEFSDSAAAEVRSAVDSLRRDGGRAIVLDLRGNPGGLLEQGVAVSQLFLRQGERIVTLRGRAPGMTRDIVADATGPFGTVPVVVLVNDGSASAAEIVAGALQDLDRALVVGVPTFGKGSAQSVFPFGDGALKLTTARWFTPLGRSISRPAATGADADDAGAVDTAPPRVPFRTALGRTIYGGDAIVPDVIVRDTVQLAAARRLDAALAGRVPAFRDALAAAALALRSQASTPTAPVTDGWRRTLRQAMAARGADVTDDAWRSAQPVIDRLLGVEVARFAFGPDGVFARQSRDDAVLQRAIALASGVELPAQLFARARTLADAR